MRHKPTILLLPLALLTLPATASAQDVEPLSVGTVLDRVVVDNPGLARARASLEEAEVLLVGEEAALAPVLSFDASYLHADEPTRGLFEDGLRITDVYMVSGQLAKRFRWGTDLALSWDTRRLTTVQPFTIPGGGRQVETIGPNWDESLQLTLRQPLLRGFGPDANRANVAVAESQRDVAELAVRRTLSEAVLEVLATYTELVYAARDVAIQRRQLELLEEQREATEALIAAGRVAQTELDVLEQRVLVTREVALAAANQQVAQGLDLRRLWNEVDGPDTAFEPAELPELPALPPSEPDLVQLALDNNPEIALLREQIEAQQVQVAVLRDAALPQLDLSLSVGQSALSGEGFTDATEQILTLNAGNVLVGLTFSTPLGDDRSERQLEAAHLALVELEAQLDEARGRVVVEVRKVRRLSAVNAERVDLAERSVELARRNLAAEQARYQAGRSTNQVVLQYQEELERAEVRALRARTDLTLSRLQLHHLTGILLESLELEVK